MLLEWMIIGHLIGDFALQGDWIAANKGKSWEVNFYHAATHTAVLLLIVKVGTGVELAFWPILILCASHFFIDALKARWGIVKTIWQDQLLHLGVMILIWLCH